MLHQFIILNMTYFKINLKQRLKLPLALTPCWLRLSAGGAVNRNELIMYLDAW